MDATRFDSVTKLFANRRLSRRKAVTGASAGLAASALAVGLTRTASAQDATPDATPIASDTEHGPTTLFLQSFQQGGVAPKDGEEGTYTVTLEQGLGQTIFFSDRPDRIVGAMPTAQFLQTLGFEPDNPPNAALVVDRGEGETDIAVVELLNPSYDEATHTATYDVKVLAAWEETLEVGFQEEPADLAAFGASFGSAHLFIDDCPDGTMTCNHDGEVVGTIANGDHDGFCYSNAQFICVPCAPWIYGINGPDEMKVYWRDQCNSRFEACNGDCGVGGFCTEDAPLGNTLCQGG